MPRHRTIELTADGPGSCELPGEPSGAGALRRQWIGLLVPMLAMDAFVVVVVLAIVRQGPGTVPPIAWAMLAFAITVGVLFMVRVMPRRYRRILAESQGRAGTYRVRLARGDWVWSISGFGAEQLESIGVSTVGASGEPYVDVSGPDAAAWCLDLVTGQRIEPASAVQGRAEDQAGWRFNPTAGSDPQLFLTIDRADPKTTGFWNASITVIRSDGPAPETLLVQRLTPGEAEGLRPAGA
jgi:hypothetical protein